VQVAYSVRDETVTKLYIDFGVELSPLHDLHDVLERETGCRNLPAAFRREFPGSTYYYEPALRFSDWWQQELTEDQVSQHVT